MAIKLLKMRFLSDLSAQVDDHVDQLDEDMNELIDELWIVEGNIQYQNTKKLKALDKINFLKLRGESKGIMDDLFTQNCGGKAATSMLCQSGKT